MFRISGKAVTLAFLLIVASGVLGLYLGYQRAAAAPGGRIDEQGFVGALTNPNAKASNPIPEATAQPAAPDDSFIRKIAREEIQAALHPQHHAAASTDNDDSDDSDDSATTPSSAATQHAAAAAAASAPQEAAPAAPPPSSPPPPPPTPY